MSYSLLIFHFLCSFHSLDRVTGTRAFIVSFAWFSGPLCSCCILGKPRSL
jgi:hypothetical protein